MSQNQHPPATDEIRSAQLIGLAVLDAIIEAGERGAPSGVLYAALMARGCTLNQFQSLMRPLVIRGFVTESGDCYRITPAGEDFAKTLRTVLGHEGKEHPNLPLAEP